MTEPRAEYEQKSHCPACGKAGVVMSLNYVLLETRPTVRPHACGVGGPGSSEKVECAHEWLDRPKPTSPPLTAPNQRELTGAYRSPRLRT